MYRMGSALKTISKQETNEFGRLVVKELYILGKNQKWLAEQCGVNESYISRIIRGKIAPSLKITEKISLILHVDAKRLRKLVLEKVKAS